MIRDCDYRWQGLVVNLILIAPIKLDTAIPSNRINRMSENNTATAVIGYIPPLFWIPLFLSGEDEFSKYHGRQAMVILIGWILTILVVGLFLRWILGWFAPFRVVIDFIQGALYILFIVASVLGAVKAAKGELWRIPILGAFAERLNI